jgi:hypothetical protein
MVRNGCCSSLLHAPGLDLPGLYRITSAFTSNNELAEPEPARPRACSPAIHLLPFAQSISPLLTPLSLRRPGLEIARPRSPHRRASRRPDPASAPPVPSVSQGQQDTSCRRPSPSPASPMARPGMALPLVRRRPTSAVARFRTGSSRDGRHLYVSILLMRARSSADDRLAKQPLGVSGLSYSYSPRPHLVRRSTFIAPGLDLSKLAANCSFCAPHDARLYIDGPHE